MKKIFKDWTIFEKSLLCFSIVMVIISGIYSKSNLLTIFAALSGITTALLLSKGKSIGQMSGIISCTLYLIISFKNSYYGEVLIYVLLKIPMYIMGTLSWLKHKDKKTNTVSVNDINKKEWLMISLASILTFIVMYYLLRAFNTSELLISTISVVIGLIATYLLFRRSKYGFIFYVVGDIILMMLWGAPILKGNLTLLPMLINPIINMINDSYGIYNWRKLERIQKK